jgi:hypothetical protein
MATVNLARAGLAATAAVNGLRAGLSSGGAASPTYPLTDIVTWVPHLARTGTIFATPSFSMSGAGYVPAPFSAARVLAWGHSTSVQFGCTGVILAPTTRLDQSAGTPGHWLTPTGAWKQLTVGGSNTFSTPLATTVNGQVQPNYVLGDWVDVDSALPVVDSTNNPENMYLFLNRYGGDASGGYYGLGAAGNKSVQDTQRALVNMADKSFHYGQAYFQSVAGLGVVGTTVNTGWTLWSGGNGTNVGFQFRSTVPGIVVAGIGDSVMEGAFASSGTGVGAGDFTVPYFANAVQEARTLGVPLFPINLGYSGQASTISAELATRYFDQVQVPGIAILQPSRNGAWSTPNWLALEAIGDRVRDAGGYVIYITPLPDVSGVTQAAAWDSTRASVLAKSTDPRTYIADPAAALGEGVNDRDPTAALYRADGIHPNNLGHEQIRNTVVPHLRSAIAAIYAAA